MSANIANALHIAQVKHGGAVHVVALLDSNLNKGAVIFQHRALETNPAVTDDDLNWSEPYDLKFPDMIRTAGMSLLTSELDSLSKTEIDPFQLVSDGQFVYMFRQSKDDTIYVDRFVYDNVAKRFSPKWEVRYQRSKKKDVPESRKDSPDYKDMEGKSFLEPTTELPIKVSRGKFAAVLAPTAKPGLSYWHIFAVNKDDDTKLEVHSIKRAEDGLFAFFAGQMIN